jgi:hypothetical protein
MFSDRDSLTCPEKNVMTTTCIVLTVFSCDSSALRPSTSDLQHYHFRVPGCFPSWIPTNLARLASISRKATNECSRILAVLEHCPDINHLLWAAGGYCPGAMNVFTSTQNNTYVYKETHYSKHIHSHLMLSMSNIVADEKAEKQTGNNRDAMFKKSHWSDQNRPN